VQNRLLPLTQTTSGLQQSRLISLINKLPNIVDLKLSDYHCGLTLTNG